MITFENPFYLLFLFLVPVLAYGFHLQPKIRTRIPLPLVIWKNDPFVVPFSIFTALRSLSTFCFWLCLVFMIGALAGPGIVKTEKIYLNRGIDIMIVLDESPSMSAKDFQPKNRFEASKEIVSNFISSRENDAIGVVTFSSDAILRVPPTTDYLYLKEQIASLKMMEMGSGTSIGLGLAVAALHLKKSSASEQVIVLVTDGVSNEGEISPINAAKTAASLGIKIYTIGVGSLSEVPFEFKDPNSSKIFRGIAKGEYNATLLTEVAQLTGGKFFPASSSRILDGVLKNINSVEASVLKTKINRQTTPIYLVFVRLALFFLVAYIAIRKFLLVEVL